MKLYVLPPSPNTIKVLALINTLGIQVEVVPVDLAAGAHQSPEYLKMNPNGLTPLLEDGDFHLWESNAIMQYLAQTHPKAGLYPQDAKGQADVSRWINWAQAHWSPSLRPYLYERLVKPMMRQEAPDEEAVAKAEPDFKRFAKVLENHLAHHPYLVEDKLTIADFIVAANLIYAGPARIPVQEFTHLQAYVQRVTGTEAWHKAMPPMPAGASR